VPDGHLCKRVLQSLFLRTTDGTALAINDLRYVCLGVVHVANQDCLCRTNNHTGWFEPNIDAMRAEVNISQPNDLPD